MFVTIDHSDGQYYVSPARLDAPDDDFAAQCREVERLVSEGVTVTYIADTVYAAYLAFCQQSQVYDALFSALDDKVGRDFELYRKTHPEEYCATHTIHLPCWICKMDAEQKTTQDEEHAREVTDRERYEALSPEEQDAEMRAILAKDEEEYPDPGQCDGAGFRIINPSWPSGDGPYRSLDRCLGCVNCGRKDGDE